MARRTSVTTRSERGRTCSAGSSDSSRICSEEELMKHKHLTVAGAMLALAMIGAPAAALAGDTGERVGGTVEESVRTGAHAVRDGVLTFGRTVREIGRAHV